MKTASLPFILRLTLVGALWMWFSAGTLAASAVQGQVGQEQREIPCPLLKAAGSHEAVTTSLIGVDELFPAWLMGILPEAKEPQTHTATSDEPPHRYFRILLRTSIAPNAP